MLVFCLSCVIKDSSKKTITVGLYFDSISKCACVFVVSEGVSECPNQHIPGPTNALFQKTKQNIIQRKKKLNTS